VVIERIAPSIDAGRYAVKRVVGDAVLVTADIFCDGHNELAAVLRWRRVDDTEWREVAMTPSGNDSWEAELSAGEPGRYEYAVQAWIDHFASWRSGLAKKVTAGLAVSSELLEGAAFVRAGAARAGGADGAWLAEQATAIGGAAAAPTRIELALSAALADCMRRHPDRSGAAQSPAFPLWVDRERARFGAWYEMFPRSSAGEPGRHGTFKDCAARLPYVADMGFDVLYLPPIHPIGATHRKGKNNTPSAGPDDVGSPWGIGSAEGGHDAVHPALGTLADFDRLVAAARARGIEIALDLAFQCSPDHPYVTTHPEWFRKRPDGTIQYAENPPKKYQDIYPLDFENADWQGLWNELERIVCFWIDHGVSIFRVDNPHTKPFPFWDWLITEVQKTHPEVLFLAEAFTRPKVMRRLAKGGFTQSYSYFTWRNTKGELTDYFTDLTRGEPRWYMRPNLFANTPDILHEFLQFGGRPAFLIRLLLAATLGGNYGVYGPAFELCDGAAVPGTEEYADSEKYQLRHWDLERPGNLRAFIARINAIRRENPAFRYDESLRFYPIDNDQLIAYGKRTPDGDNTVLVIVNLDPHHVQSGWLTLPLAELGIGPGVSYQMHDLLGDARYLWQGARNYVELNPQATPGHIVRVRRRVRTEHDFDYFM
jgi:starch synthase (maltosyl-transferring)